MNKTVEVLMERDGLTEKEAKKRISEVYDMMAECNFDMLECEDIMYNELGLEMDYIFDILF